MPLRRNGAQRPTLLVFAFLGACAHTPEATQQRIVTLDEEALEAYQAGDAPGAERKLLEAVALEREAHLQRTTAGARAHADLGALYLLAFGERGLGIEHLAIALRDRPDVRPASALTRGPVVRVLASMQRASESPAGVAAATTDEEAPRKGRKRRHKKPRRRAEEPAAAPAAAAAPTPAPAPPPPVELTAAAEPEVAEDNEEPSLIASHAATSEPRGDVSARARASDASEPPSRDHRREAGQFWVGFAAGAGSGWHPEGRLEGSSDLQTTSGFSNTGMILMPELGWQITRGFGLSIQGRHQFLPTESAPDGSATPPKMANAGFLRLNWTLGSGNAVFLVSVLGGGGDGFRLVVPRRPSAGLVHTDSVRGGPFAFGPAVGGAYHLSRTLAFFLEARTLVGAPNWAAVLEGGAGAQVSF